MNYRIVRTNTEDSSFRILEKRLDDELRKIYGQMQSKYTSNNIVKGLKTIIIYDGETPIACGCLKFLYDDSAEVKRVFVSPEYRGKGISKLVMEELEKWAVDSSINELVLETGSKQKAAISLYIGLGYVRIENYGPYVGDTNSNCMKKILR